MDQSPPSNSSSTPVDSSLPALPSTTVDNVLHLLDVEIDSVQSKRSQNGLNFWAVLAAIVGLLWLLTGELKEASADWISIGRLIVALTLPIDTLKWLYFALDMQPSARSSEARFHWSHSSFSTTRAGAVTEFIRSILIVAVAFMSLSWFPLSLVAFSYLITALLMAIVLVGSFTPLFVASEGFRNKYTYVFFVALIVPPIVALAFILPSLPFPLGDAIDLYRISGLIVGISYLFFFLASVLSRSSVQPALSDIRRNLALGKITLDRATNEVETALRGIGVLDALKDNFLKIVSILEEMDQRTNQAISALNSIETNLPLPKDLPEVIDRKIATMEVFSKTCDGLINEYSALNKQHGKEVARMGKLMGRIMILRESRDTISNVENLVNARGQFTTDNYQKMLTRRVEVAEKVQALKQTMKVNPAAPPSPVVTRESLGQK